jgi:hypothetical protein
MYFTRKHDGKFYGLIMPWGWYLVYSI